MSEFVSFLKEYKEVLIGSLCLIITLITLFVKRRPKTIDEFFSIVDEVCLTLPTFINKVECPSNGLCKKKEVRSMAYNLIRKRLGRDLCDKEIDYSLSKIDNSIELILSTPQKKQCD